MNKISKYHIREWTEHDGVHLVGAYVANYLRQFHSCDVALLVTEGNRVTGSHTKHIALGAKEGSYLHLFYEGDLAVLPYQVSLVEQLLESGYEAVSRENTPSDGIVVMECLMVPVGILTAISCPALVCGHDGEFVYVVE